MISHYSMCACVIHMHTILIKDDCARSLDMIQCESVGVCERERERERERGTERECVCGFVCVCVIV